MSIKFNTRGLRQYSHKIDICCCFLRRKPPNDEIVFVKGVCFMGNSFLQGKRNHMITDSFGHLISHEASMKLFLKNIKSKIFCLQRVQRIIF